MIRDELKQMAINIAVNAPKREGLENMVKQNEKEGVGRMIQTDDVGALVDCLSKYDRNLKIVPAWLGYITYTEAKLHGEDILYMEIKSFYKTDEGVSE